MNFRHNPDDSHCDCDSCFEASLKNNEEKVRKHMRDREEYGVDQLKGLTVLLVVSFIMKKEEQSEVCRCKGCETKVNTINGICEECREYVWRVFEMMLK